MKSLQVLIALGIMSADAGAGSWCNAPPAPGFEELEAVDVSDGWFKVYAVAPGVFAIHEPRQYETVTAFLVAGTERAVLFDSGLGIASIRRIVDRLSPLPVTVINSHTHFDHVGGNREFTDVRNLDLPFSRASARGEAGEELREYARDTLAEDRVCGPLPAGVTGRDYAMQTWTVAAHVRDGERLELGGRTLEVLATPGHTPDSLCLLDVENGLLLTGDTFYAGELYLWAPETDVKAYAASIDRLAALAPGLKRLLPAHGPPVADPGLLRELQAALESIEAGSTPFETTGQGQRRYEFRDFSILTAGPAGAKSN
ncbi:MAG: MBL fold metallo-hydrolase [Gammaproteobacteria bacterium]|nr:MBL fold metallo-hydrolase [Gammaproteobacteria bacterium]